MRKVKLMICYVGRDKERAIKVSYSVDIRGDFVGR